MDGAYAAVKFHSRDNDGASTSKDDGSTLLQDCRLLRKDELQVTVALCVCVCVIWKCACLLGRQEGRGRGSLSEMVVVFISHAD